MISTTNQLRYVMVTIAIAFATFSCMPKMPKTAERIDQGISEWMDTRFTVTVPAKLDIVEFVDYLVSSPPYNVGFNISLKGPSLSKKQLELSPGEYSRRDLLEKATSAFDTDFIVDEDHMLHLQPTVGRGK